MCNVKQSRKRGIIDEKHLKQLLCSALIAAIFLLTTPTTTFSQETVLPSANFLAKTAIVTNVAEDGTNLTDDLHPNQNTFTQDITLKITPRPNNSIQINSSIDNREISVLGTPMAKSENEHAIFFNAISNNPSFEVVNMEYVDNAETNMFFKSYKTTKNANKILKLYLKDLSSNTRDYIILECFDYEITNFASIISSLPQDTTMGAWAAREFIPTSSDFIDITPLATPSNTVRTYSVKFQHLAFEETHTITLATDCTYSNIRVGQMSDIIYRIEIVGKTLSCPGSPSLNSKTESSLHVNTAALRQTTVPNAAFISTSISGKVLNSSSSGASLSASISINLAALGVSLSIPVSFTGNNIVNINSTYTSYVNGRNGQYTRSIKTTMQNNYKLTQINHYFEVRSTIADFGNVSRNSANHKGTWDITIINAADKSTQNKTISQNVPIAIKN